jgi:hypothetical protein
MKVRLLATALVFAMSGAFAAAPAARSAEAQKVIDLTRHLEQQPLADDAKDARAWLIGWITQSPDIQINVCDTLQVLKKDEGYPWTSKLVVQTMFGMAAWELAHPQAQGMDLDVQLAGVRSAMKVYASILREHPDAKFAPMEALLAHDAVGDLPEHMQGVVASECAR